MSIKKVLKACQAIEEDDSGDIADRLVALQKSAKSCDFGEALSALIDAALDGKPLFKLRRVLVEALSEPDLDGKLSLADPEHKKVILAVDKAVLDLGKQRSAMLGKSIAKLHAALDAIENSPELEQLTFFEEELPSFLWDIQEGILHIDPALLSQERRTALRTLIDNIIASDPKRPDEVLMEQLEFNAEVSRIFSNVRGMKEL